MWKCMPYIINTGMKMGAMQAQNISADIYRCRTARHPLRKVIQSRGNKWACLATASAVDRCPNMWESRLDCDATSVGLTGERNARTEESTWVADWMVVNCSQSCHLVGAKSSRGSFIHQTHVSLYIYNILFLINGSHMQYAYTNNIYLQ